MKKLMITMLMFALASKADVTLTNATVQMQVLTTNKTVTIANAKKMWIGFSWVYLPPVYTSCVFTVSSIFKDLDTGKIIPGTRATRVMSQQEAFVFMWKHGIDFAPLGFAIGQAMDAVLMDDEK